MKKISLILAAVLVSLSVCPLFAQARASEYICSYTVDATQGDNPGEVNFDFTVRATYTVSKIGALQIEIYKGNGQYITTVLGTPSNGLLSAQSSRIHARVYTYEGVPGTSYYAKITVCAGSLTYYDTREVTTDVVVAPY